MIKYPYGSWTAPLPTVSKIKKIQCGVGRTIHAAALLQTAGYRGQASENQDELPQGKEQPHRGAYM